MAKKKRAPKRSTKVVPVDKDNMQAVMFAENACQYYATARFAMYAQRLPVCGTLFHYAVELALKGGLARKRELAELKDMGHSLQVLWRASKMITPTRTYTGTTRPSRMVDKFYVLRYPGTKGSIAIYADWSVMPVMAKTSGGLRAPKHYPLIVSDVDDLFADIFRAASWNPALAPFMGTNAAALEAVRFLNDQSVFLAGQPKLTTALQTGETKGRTVVRDLLGYRWEYSSLANWGDLLWKRAVDPVLRRFADDHLVFLRRVRGVIQIIALVAALMIPLSFFWKTAHMLTASGLLFFDIAGVFRLFLLEEVTKSLAGFEHRRDNLPSVAMRELVMPEAGPFDSEAPHVSRFYYQKRGVLLLFIGFVLQLIGDLV